MTAVLFPYLVDARHIHADLLDDEFFHHARRREAMKEFKEPEGM